MGTAPKGIERRKEEKDEKGDYHIPRQGSGARGISEVRGRRSPLRKQ